MYPKDNWFRILFTNGFSSINLSGDAVKRKSSSILRVLVIAFLFLFSPAYIDYQELIEADFLSSGEKYEDRDAEDFSFDKQLNLITNSSPFSIFLLLSSNLFDSLTDPSSPIPSSDPKSFTLRC
jgi:hypothetical protein